MRSRAIIICLSLALAGMLAGQEMGNITITTTSLPTATLGIPYSFQLQETGGQGQVQWSVCGSDCNPSGDPATLGVTLSSTGMLSGTPTATGSVSFLVEVFDSDEDYGQAALTISVVPCTPAITSLPNPLPPGDVSVRYQQVQFSASGCPDTYTYAVQVSPFSPNDVPPGLNLTSGGTLSGTPITAGTYPFTLTATDQNGNATQVPYSITINPLPTITTASPLPNGPVGVAYSEQIAATGGTPPYIFSMNANPPGITITRSGVLNGTPTQAGTYKFDIGVTDSLGGQEVAPFQVTFATAVSQLQVTPLALTFNANQGGNAPPSQAITIVPANGATPPVSFQVSIDAGQTGTPAPSWITVSPLTGSAPAALVVNVDQGTLAAGTYPARIQVIDSDGLATSVAISLNVTSVAQQLTAAPPLLSIAANAASPGTLTQAITVSNTGASSLPFTASVAGKSPWITSVTASSNTTTRNSPVYVQVVVNTDGLEVGSYNDAIVLSSSAGNIQVPVSLFVAASGPILDVTTTGMLFTANQGAASIDVENIEIADIGTAGSTVNWTASVVSGSSWLTLTSSSGTASPNNPGTLSMALTPNATQMPPGVYYAIVKIADPNSLNSPQYVSTVLNLQASTAAPSPNVGPGGMFFTAPAGGSAPAPQKISINTASAQGLTFSATTSTTDGSPWLSASPTSGPASGLSAGIINVSVNPSGLAAGIYSGSVNISIGNMLQSVNVTFVVQPGATSSAIAHLKPEVSGCTPSKLAITETDLPNNFAIPAGWPATLVVQLDNDCGAAVTNGSVIASFSNGDPALPLVGDNLGNYIGNWQPGAVNTSTTITLNANADGLTAATAKLYGGIAANQTPPPTLASGGTLNNLNPVVGAPLAPGTIAQVFGTGLAASSVSTSVLPLPTTFNNTFALVGSAQAPLYFLSNGQINIQIPYEVTATQQVPLLLSVNNALTLPQMVNVVPATPGVLSMDDGPNTSSPQNGAHIIAQHSDFSLVSSSNPAKPGEFLIMYLVGLGATNPSVASGAPAPSTPPLATVTVQPVVTVGSQPATVAFAGLSPGFVGLYQINFQVPSSASSGELEVDVTQNGVAANPTLLPVSQ